MSETSVFITLPCSLASHISKNIDHMYLSFCCWVMVVDVSDSLYQLVENARAAQEASLRGKTFALKGISKVQIAELQQQVWIADFLFRSDDCVT